jgi:hypothetical protein
MKLEPLSHIQNQLEVYLRLKHKSLNCKIVGRKHGGNFHEISLHNYYYYYWSGSQSTDNTRKNRQMGLNQAKGSA